VSLSDVARQAAYAQETDENFLYLVTIDHPDLPGGLTIRVWNGTQDGQEDLVSNGETYKAFPFQIAFPDRQPDQPPKSRVTISAVSDPNNADTDVVTIVRSLTSPPRIGLTCVLASQPDVIEATAPEMILTQVDFDSLTIDGDLTYERVLEEPFPAGTYSPSAYPGVFA
jgi:hypothetical protein